MAKIAEMVWDMVEHYWDVTIEVDGKLYEISCVKAVEEEKMLVCNFKHKESKSLYIVGCCIEAITDEYMIMCDFSHIKSQFQGKDFVINARQFSHTIWQQLAMQVTE